MINIIINMVIRKLKEEDIDLCISVCQECFNIEGYSYNTRFEFENQFKEGYITPEFYVCEIDNNIVGVMGLSGCGFDSSVFSMCTAYIKPDFQKKGIGKALFSNCLNRVKELKGECIFVTSKKSKFVQSLGFNPIPSPDSYKEDGWVIYQYLIN